MLAPPVAYTPGSPIVLASAPITASRIIHTAAPSPTPLAAERRHSRVSSGKFGSAPSRRGTAATPILLCLRRRQTHAGVADQINRSHISDPIDDDLDAIAFPHFTDRAARERFRTDMPDARAGRNAGEPRIGDQRDLFAEGKMLERGGDLIVSSMPVPMGPRQEDHHVAGLDGCRCS